MTHASIPLSALRYIAAVTPCRMVRLTGGLHVCASRQAREAISLIREALQVDPIDRDLLELLVDAALETFAAGMAPVTGRVWS